MSAAILLSLCTCETNRIPEVNRKAFTATPVNQRYCQLSTNQRLAAKSNAVIEPTSSHIKGITVFHGDSPMEIPTAMVIAAEETEFAYRLLIPT